MYAKDGAGTSKHIFSFHSQKPNIKIKIIPSSADGERET